MSRTPERIEYIANTREQAASDVTAALRLLLERRHLYQSVTVVRHGELELENGAVSLGAQQVARLTLLPWLPLDPVSPGRKSEVGSPYGVAPNDLYIRFLPPDAKLFCTVCARLEAFNPVSLEEFLSRDGTHGFETKTAGKNTVQVFVFSYQCQSCKGVPEVFLVRRQGLRLTLAGRTPIEHVEVPASIPKTVSKFFSGGVVAHQSGQTLSGLFQLRTLLEQFARSTTTSTSTWADAVMEAYMETLPPDFKARFPSMRSLYGELSADLHSATASPELFDKACQQITEHFEARKLFKLEEPKTTSA